jgi:hypothetical protein
MISFIRHVIKLLHESARSQKENEFQKITLLIFAIIIVQESTPRKVRVKIDPVKNQLHGVPTVWLTVIEILELFSH